MPECRNCGEVIHFDPKRKSQSGKFIPLEEDGEPHQCPESDYAKKQRTGDSSSSTTAGTTTIKTESVESVALKGVLGNTLDIIARVERLETRIDELSGFIKKLTDHLVSNPLDDDGDSERENPEREP